MQQDKSGWEPDTSDKMESTNTRLTQFMAYVFVALINVVLFIKILFF